MSIKGRLGRLECASRDNRCVVIWKRHDETGESAMERWRAANPGHPDSAAVINEIRHEIVDPPQRQGRGKQVYLVGWQEPTPEGTAT